MSGPQKASLQSLPQELLFKIKWQIHGLPNHVNFSLTCRAAYHLYDAAFWEVACRSSGYGMKIPRREQMSMEHGKLWPWAGLARIVVQDSNLAKGYDEHEMLYDYGRLGGYDGLVEHKVIQAKDMQNLDVLLDLTPLAELDAHCHDAHDRFILKLTREGECPEDVDIVIVQHPFLANQFITVPPINELRVDDGSLVAFLDHKEETLYGNSLDITRFENIPEPKPIIIRNAGGVTLGDFYLKYAEGLRKNSRPDWGSNYEVE